MQEKKRWDPTNWLASIFFSPRDSHRKGMLVLLHPGLAGVTEFDTESKWRIVSFRVTASNDRVLNVYFPSGQANLLEKTHAEVRFQ